MRCLNIPYIYLLWFSRYVNHNIGLEPQWDWLVEAAGQEAGQPWFADLDKVQIRHAGSGKLLAATGRAYPADWGEGLSEVVAGSGAGDTWQVVLNRPPTIIESFTEEQREELYGVGTTEQTSDRASRRASPASSTADLTALLAR